MTRERTIIDISHLVFGLLIDGKRNAGVRNNAQQAGGYPAVECLETVLTNHHPQQLWYPHAGNRQVS